MPISPENSVTKQVYWDSDTGKKIDPSELLNLLSHPANETTPQDIQSTNNYQTSVPLEILDGTFHEISDAPEKNDSPVILLGPATDEQGIGIPQESKDSVVVPVLSNPTNPQPQRRQESESNQNPAENLEQLSTDDLIEKLKFTGGKAFFQSDDIIAALEQLQHLPPTTSREELNEYLQKQMKQMRQTENEIIQLTAILSTRTVISTQQFAQLQDLEDTLTKQQEKLTGLTPVKTIQIDSEEGESEQKITAQEPMAVFPELQPHVQTPETDTIVLPLEQPAEEIILPHLQTQESSRGDTQEAQNLKDRQIPIVTIGDLPKEFDPNRHYAMQYERPDGSYEWVIFSRTTIGPVTKQEGEKLNEGNGAPSQYSMKDTDWLYQYFAEPSRRDSYRNAYVSDIRLSRDQSFKDLGDGRTDIHPHMAAILLRNYSTNAASIAGMHPIHPQTLNLVGQVAGYFRTPILPFSAAVYWTPYEESFNNTYTAIKKASRIMVHQMKYALENNMLQQSDYQRLGVPDKKDLTQALDNALIELQTSDLMTV